MIYTVKEGDTLYKISREYDIPVTILINDNGLPDDDLIVGEDIVVLPPAVTYTVRDGDTVSSVAERYGTSARSIFRENPALSGSETLYPGQTLVISRRSGAWYGTIALDGFAYPFIEDTDLRAVLPFLTYLSVFTHGIAADGSLIAPEGEERLISLAAEYGVTPVMMLTSLAEDGNFSNELVRRILLSDDLSSRLINEAAAKAKSAGYGALDVDFEYIGDLAPRYVAFLERMKSALSPLSLFVSLAPKTSSNMPGILYEGHNYEEIGRVADRTIVMAYEWGYTYGPPMAVAPLDKVEKVVNYAASAITPEKILLGTPNYGYDFALPYVKGESAARSLSNAEARDLALAVGAAIHYDPVSQAPYFNYYDAGREHIVWFENARSVRATGELAAASGLSGISVWNVMKFFPPLYMQLNSMFDIK